MIIAIKIEDTEEIKEAKTETKDMVEETRITTTVHKTRTMETMEETEVATITTMVDIITTMEMAEETMVNVLRMIATIWFKENPFLSLLLNQLKLKKLKIENLLVVLK